MYPLVFDRGRVCLEYAKFCLLSEEFTSYAIEASARARMPKLNREQLLAYEFPIPPLAVQKRVAAELTAAMASVDKARRAAQDRLAAAEALPAAYLREVFEGPKANEWETRPLIELCEGPGQYGTSEKSNGEERGLPVLGMPHIHEGRIRWERVSFVELSPNEQTKYLLNPGDILFNRTNSAELVGKTAVYDGARPAVFASYLIRFRARCDLADPRFISAFINSPGGRAFIERYMARAVGQVNVSASTMHRLPVPCPDVAVQTRLCDRLDSVRTFATQSVVARCREELAAIEALPAALLRKAFASEP
jgi:type I restriction enzyme S subunit